MRVTLPGPGAYAALVLAGLTQAGEHEEAVMALVLKAAYDLVDDGNGVHDLVAAGDSARAALVLADEGCHLYTDANGAEHVVPAAAFAVASAGDPDHPGAAYFLLGAKRHYVADLSSPSTLDFDLVREADLALDKAFSDIVVEGLSQTTTGAAVTVDGSIWFVRAPETARRRDTDRNLFGWQGRTEPPRSTVLSQTYDRDHDGALPHGDTAVFNNVFRRSTGFSAPDGRNQAPLPSGGLVRVFLNQAATGAAAFAVRLPALAMAMRLRVYCGHGPDQAPRWRILPRPNLVPDTLVLRPQKRTAEILWRGRWPAALSPTDTYRAVELRGGGF